MRAENPVSSYGIHSFSLSNLLNESYAYALEKQNGERRFYDMPGTGFMFGMEFSF